MQGDNTLFLTIEEQPLILKALDALSVAVESERGESLGTFKRLEEFAKEGRGRVILNLRAVDGPPSGMSQEIGDVGASLVGGVLFVTCQVSTQELFRIKLLTHHDFFPKHLI